MEKSTERSPQLPFIKRNFIERPPPRRAAGRGSLDPRPFYFRHRLDLRCGSLVSMFSPSPNPCSAHLPQGQHLQNTTGTFFCGFCCNIASLHRNLGQPPLPPPHSRCSWVLCAHCWSVSDHTGNTGTPLSAGQAPAFNVSVTSCSPAKRLSKHSGAPFFPR